MPRPILIAGALLAAFWTAASAQSPEGGAASPGLMLLDDRAAADAWRERHLAANGSIGARGFVSQRAARLGAGTLATHPVRLPACPGCRFGYDMLCAKPFAGDPDGLRVRLAQGDHSALTARGVKHIRLPGGEVAGALQRGLIDCLAYVTDF